MMTTRPLDFLAPMIRAILDGRKTMTRRIISRGNTYRDGMPWRGLPAWDAHDWNDAFVDDGPSPAGNPGPYLKVKYPPDGTRHRVYPIWQPGDRIWVREVCRAVEADDTFKRHAQYHADNALSAPLAASEDNSSEAFGKWWTMLAHRSDDPDVTGGKWVPSIHMPRWASRLTLTVASRKVERLQDISEEDAIAEGVRAIHHGDGAYYYSAFRDEPHRKNWVDPVDAFRELWTSLHGPDAWERNDWVAAIRFTVERRNIDAEGTR